MGRNSTSTSLTPRIEEACRALASELEKLDAWPGENGLRSQASWLRSYVDRNKSPEMIYDLLDGTADLARTLAARARSPEGSGLLPASSSAADLLAVAATWIADAIELGVIGVPHDGVLPDPARGEKMAAKSIEVIRFASSRDWTL